MTASPRIAATLAAAWPLIGALPALALGVPFFLLPLVMVFWVSFFGRSAVSSEVSGVVANYLAILSEPYYLTIYANTLLVAVGVTLATLIVGFPFALHVVRWAGRWRAVLVWILYLPIIVSVIVRVFGWIVITADRGLINHALMGLGLVSQPVRLLYEVEAMVLAMTHRYLPLMVLPLANAIAKIDPDLERAATDLGAGRLRILLTVTLPLSAPGIFAGSQLVFASVLSDFVMPSLLGTTRFPMMAPAIFDEAVQLVNRVKAASIASMLLAFVLCYLAASSWAYRRVAPWARGD